MALVLHPEDLLFFTQASQLFDQLGAHQPGLAARSLIHICISLLEEEQTRSLMEGRTPSSSPPALYPLSVLALLEGFTT